MPVPLENSRFRIYSPFYEPVVPCKQLHQALASVHASHPALTTGRNCTKVAQIQHEYRLTGEKEQFAQFLTFTSLFLSTAAIPAVDRQQS